MSKRDLLFENVCRNVYSDVHAGFVADFHLTIFPLFENMATIDSFSKLRVGLFESTDRLSWDQINAIFKAAELVTKDTKIDTIKRGASELARNATGKMSSNVGRLQEKYKGLPPIELADTKFKKLKEQMLRTNSSDLAKTVNLLERHLSNKNHVNIVICAMTAGASLLSSDTIKSVTESLTIVHKTLGKGA